MSADQPRCEPPEGWRDRDGWHWLQYRDEPMCFGWWQSGHSEWWFPEDQVHAPVADMSPEWRYLSPVAPPAVVRGLVDALEGLLVGCEYRPGGYSFAFGDDVPAGWGTKTIPTDAALDAARSALAAAKEAGP